MALFRFVFTGVLAMAGVGLAHAQSLNLTLLSYQKDYLGYSNFNSTSSGEDYVTLQTLLGASSTPSLNRQLQLFCIELAQNAPATAQSYNVVPIDTADNGRSASSFDAVSGIAPTGLGAARAANLELLYGFEFGQNYAPQNLSLLDAAAFQLAVWKLSHDDTNLGSVSGTTGYFVTGADSGLLAAANKLLSDVQANQAVITPMALVALHSTTAQDYLLPLSQLNVSQVPEPSAYAALLGAMVLALMLLSQRRQFFPWKSGNSANSPSPVSASTA